MNPKEGEEWSDRAIMHKGIFLGRWKYHLELAHTEEQVWYSAWEGPIEISILLR